MLTIRRILVQCALIGLTSGHGFAVDQQPVGKSVPKQQLQTTKPPTTTVPPKGGVVAVPAKITLDCGGKKYDLSTGNGNGTCQTNYDAPNSTKPNGASCTDGKGNSSSATCAGCDHSGGTGSCTLAK